MSMLVELQVEGNPLAHPPPMVCFVRVGLCVAAGHMSVLCCVLLREILSITCLL